MKEGRCAGRTEITAAHSARYRRDPPPNLAAPLATDPSRRRALSGLQSAITRIQPPGRAPALTADGRRANRTALWLRASLLNRPGRERDDKGPGMPEVLLGALNIMRDRIIRSRMAGDPPDVLLAPRIAHIGLLEFDRARGGIAEGRACVQRMLPALQDVVGL